MGKQSRSKIINDFAKKCKPSLQTATKEVEKVKVGRISRSNEN